jgi:hypothetical protein
MLENARGDIEVSDGAVELAFRAFEIKTIRISLS